VSQQDVDPDPSPVLRCRGVTRRFGSTVAVDHLDLDVHRGELLAVLGPSGCGKTTALRLVAGLDVPDEGTIEVRGRIVADGRTATPPERRHIGMVFQDYALFPHLDVAANVAYGLARDDADRDATVEDALALVGLEGLGDRRPSQLSGGQQQRVALARALAPGPDLVLLDEPFSNLDAALREGVRTEVRDILKRAGATALFVTHDQDEALSLADRVAVLQAGRLHQVATPHELYTRPATRFVAEFVGDAEVLDGRRAGQFLVDTAVGRLGTVSRLEVADLAVVVRPEAVRVHRHGTPNATVADAVFFGHDQLLTIDLDEGPRLRSRTSADVLVVAGDRVRVGVDTKVVTYPA
jgi:iron(III) transport system ATP-binding protein